MQKSVRQAVAMALKQPRRLETFTDRVWGLVAGALALPRQVSLMNDNSCVIS
jgi:hypothetical protein